MIEFGLSRVDLIHFNVASAIVHDDPVSTLVAPIGEVAVIGVIPHVALATFQSTIQHRSNANADCVGLGPD